jgi:hypothetical protein
MRVEKSKIEPTEIEVTGTPGISGGVIKWIFLSSPYMPADPDMLKMPQPPERCRNTDVLFRSKEGEINNP